MTPFDYVKAINEKADIAYADGDYVPYIINRAMSNNIQTLFFANALNQYHYLPKKMQFDFLYNGVPKGKRYDKWTKRDSTDKDVTMLQDYYGINKKRAEEALKILSREQLENVREVTNTGGKR